MCGICGVIDYNKNTLVCEGLIRDMSGKLKHRGPDDEGIFIIRGNISVGLGHRRLSIIDLSLSGHQPMSNEDASIWIVFNGEIYNFQELNAQLKEKGHVFKSNTDTEAIIHLYEEYSEGCIEYLRGMFAFALWDSKKEILLLARDRLGKKPLVYSYSNGVFCFSSELDSLLQSGFITKEINFEALDSYLTYGYIPAPLTIYRNVFKLPPACRLILKNREISLKRYWDLNYANKLKISEDDAAGEVFRLLSEATKIRMYSDVPLGAFLSGGIDSSNVVALMSKFYGKGIKTFSIGFREQDYSELKYARNIAERYATDHHEFIVKPNALEILPLLIERYGEPFADSSCIPTYYVAQQTRRFVTVALNGDGGDELFAGYERYQAMLISQKLPYFSKSLLNFMAKLLPDSVNAKNKIRRLKRFSCALALPFEERYLKWVGIFDNTSKNELYSEDFIRLTSQSKPVKFISSFLNSANSSSMLDSLLYADTMTYLPYDLLVKVDIATMANSLEARSPFLDHKLIEFVAQLPQEYKMSRLIKKYLLKKATKGLIPEENINRRKMGFAVPVGEWLRNELRGFLYENLLSGSSLNRGYFKPEAIRHMVNQHAEGKSDYSFQLWSLLMLELWHKRFID